MKYKIAPVILLILSLVSFAQQNTFNKRAELQKFVERGGKVEEVSANVYKLTYIDGTQRLFNFNPSPTKNNNTEGFDSTIINVWEIDTTLYAHKFKFWQKVNFITNSATETATIDDINNNGLLEYYGPVIISPPVEIWEQNSQGIFHKIYTYDSTSYSVYGIGDVNSDGFKDVHIRTTDTLNGKFYKADSLGTFPTTYSFIFYYYPNIITNETFDDFDKNGITDCAFIDASNPSRIIISEYRDSINNFTTIFDMPTPGDDLAGLAIGDYDQDNETDLVISTGLSGVYVIEAKDINQYSVVWNGQEPTDNPYMLTSTNDIDGNGKPEFWVGGMSFTTGISKFWCYESDGDNSYIPVAGIELRYLGSLFSFHLQAFDMDSDGVQELVINIGDYLLIMRFKGKPNQHNYKLFYAKIGEATQPGAYFLPSTICDFNNNGKKDILLSMAVWPPPYLSYILVQDTLTSVTDNNFQIPSKFDLSQNYPNPFNPSTNFKVSVNEPLYIKVNVYDVLGKEIKLLLNENLPAGEYTIQWDGKDNEGKDLSGGVYFIQMIAGDYHKTIKTILLK